jgi:hypothetical protein
LPFFRSLYLPSTSRKNSGPVKNIPPLALGLGGDIKQASEGLYDFNALRLCRALFVLGPGGIDYGFTSFLIPMEPRGQGISI